MTKILCMKKYFKLFRVHHYIKNLLIFAPLACSGRIYVLDLLFKCICAFIVFSACSSVIYIINDICDAETDKRHPVKCNRPIASGEIKNSQALLAASVLILIGVFSYIYVYNLSSMICIVIYVLTNLCYSLGMKNVPIVDVALLASGFLIRISFGACITGIPVSDWLYLTVLMMAFYFALGKRRNELKRLDVQSVRSVLRKYPLSFLDKNMYLCLALANVFYSLWSMDKSTVSHYNNNYLVYTVPFVLLITMRYNLDLEGETDGDPVEVLIHDKSLVILSIVYLAVMGYILYA